MTKLTLLPEFPLMVIITMTTRTGRSNACQLSIDMTLFAGDILMRTPKWETRRSVIHIGIFPFGGIVAGLTITAKAILMDIIFLMTRDT